MVLEQAGFNIQINGDMICQAWGESNDSTFPDEVHTSCSAATVAAEGDMQTKTIENKKSIVRKIIENQNNRNCLNIFP